MIIAQLCSSTYVVICVASAEPKMSDQNQNVQTCGIFGLILAKNYVVPNCLHTCKHCYCSFKGSVPEIDFQIPADKCQLKSVQTAAKNGCTLFDV